MTVACFKLFQNVRSELLMSLLKEKRSILTKVESFDDTRLRDHMHEKSSACLTYCAGNTPPLTTAQLLRAGT
jgi:predicted lipoprotein with Yx(FWY)xxD motif